MKLMEKQLYKHKAQTLQSNGVGSFSFWQNWLSLVYRFVSSVQFFPLLKNRENDMGLGKDGTKL